MTPDKLQSLADMTLLFNAILRWSKLDIVLCISDSIRDYCLKCDDNVQSLFMEVS